ncbi:gamma-glutamylcyclotransferase family protein [Haloterrigena alkaliphila]|uniref:Gamma-glutamylcyclotransferase n=1 Tax=Haloterrigena alkaliphila TaxID=2816475 RepID=A0A8A2VD22_9EURY|nr:gamma-glutamylcyclotransferase family protein [Haloterrigena alkaliphila]QSW99929.1 gamma-glutamylcyclotransferase [Haloterrigena alkaliphila]
MLVFVYGTLTDPDQVAALLESGPGEYAFAGPATLEGLHRVEGEYPTLAPGGSVEGRLLAVDDAALERLDRYEGVDRGLYVRVAVPRVDGASVQTYVGDPARLGAEVSRGWPDAGSFRNAVRDYIVGHSVTVRTLE